MCNHLCQVMPCWFVLDAHYNKKYYYIQTIFLMTKLSLGQLIIDIIGYWRISNTCTQKGELYNTFVNYNLFIIVDVSFFGIENFIEINKRQKTHHTHTKYAIYIE